MKKADSTHPTYANPTTANVGTFIHPPAKYIEIDREGIAYALNDGIDYMLQWGFDMVGYLAAIG